MFLVILTIIYEKDGDFMRFYCEQIATYLDRIYKLKVNLIQVHFKLLTDIFCDPISDFF